ncbi:hypothetical protein FQR65_LT20589 [Abscondita terminalis]|nr:hypothetical protein FQR65_LT20589 [Abscondita terminalis]
MFGMVHIATPWGTTLEIIAILGHGLGDEDRQVRIAREITRSADAVHHVRAAHMRGIDVAVDIELQRRIDGDDTQAPHDLRRVADLLRTQHDALAVVLDIGQESSRRPAWTPVMRTLDAKRTCLVFRTRRLGSPCSTLCNGADAGLQGQQAVVQPARIHFASQEGLMCAQMHCLVVGGRRWHGLSGSPGNDDGGDPGGSTSI